MKKYLGDRPDLERKLVQFRALKAMLKYKVRTTLSCPLSPCSRDSPLARARTHSADIAGVSQSLCQQYQDEVAEEEQSEEENVKSERQRRLEKATFHVSSRIVWTKGKNIVNKYLKELSRPKRKCAECDSLTHGHGVRGYDIDQWRCMRCYMNLRRVVSPHQRCAACQKVTGYAYKLRTARERYCGTCIKDVVEGECSGSCVSCSTTCTSSHDSVRTDRSDGDALYCSSCWDKRGAYLLEPDFTSAKAIGWVDGFKLRASDEDVEKDANIYMQGWHGALAMVVFDAHIDWLKVCLAPIFADFKKSSEWRELKLSTTDADADLPEEMLGGGATAGGAEAEQPAAEQETAMASDSFADYVPAKLTYGPPHIEHVVESASLACVSPTDVTYTTLLPAEVLSSGVLSRVQLEAVIYVLQQHEKLLPSGVRAGFFIGDGTGVGKGRELAAIIWENWLRGRRRAVWFTCNTDLTVDARRDLDDIGARHIGLQSLTALSYDPIAESFDEGVLLVTYSCLVAKQGKAKATERTRVEQLHEWLDGSRFDGVLAFDEAHKAKGAAHNQPVGKTVVELQAALPLARVVYLSATGATHVQDMSYMTRLGLWGPGTYFSTFPAIEQAHRDRVEMRPGSAR